MQVNSLNHIADLIENCISLQEFSSNPRLVTFLTYYNFIPLNELIANFKNIKITLDDAIQACTMSNILNRFLVLQPVPGLFVPYQVVPATLILSNVPLKCNLEKLKLFITEISGTDEFELEKNEDDEDIPTYSIKFKAVETSLYFWRALKYVPFENAFITVRPKILKIEPITPKSHQTSKYYSHHSSKNNRNRYENNKKRRSSSDDNENENDNYTYNNNYRSRNSQTPDTKATLQVIKRKDYMSNAPSIKIECPNISNVTTNK